MTTTVGRIEQLTHEKPPLPDMARLPPVRSEPLLAWIVSRLTTAEGNPMSVGRDTSAEIVERIQHYANTERRGASSRLSGGAGSAVVTELNALREWIKDESNYRREDAVDEISRAIVNRINQIKSSGWNPPNVNVKDEL